MRYRVEPDTLIRGLTHWAGLLPLDFPYMLPLGAFVAAVPMAKRGRPLGLVSKGIEWMTGWLAVFLP